MDKKLIKIGIADGLLTVIYVGIVAWVMMHAQYVFGNKPGTVGVIAFLLLFVVSAAVTSALVLGKPVLLYWDGKKKEAVKVFGLTVGTLVVVLILVLFGLFLNK